MNKPILKYGTKCVVCGFRVDILENYEFFKMKRGKTKFFHTKCYENMKKKG